MPATLTKEQLARLSPQHRAILLQAEDNSYRLHEALSMAVTSGCFFGRTRTEVKDFIISACASGVIEYEQIGASGFKIDIESFNAWLEMSRPISVGNGYAPAKPVDWQMIGFCTGIGMLIYMFYVLFS